jgi:4-amino-4-deoxy-L-arabinose transferase-like glycosyltransferase
LTFETTPAAAETVRTRLLFLALALAVAGAFFLGTHRYWVPADPDVDENAYLVSGRLLAQTGSPGFLPPDPYHFAGPMWIRTVDGRFYPKYPLGQTLLLAAAIKAGGLRAAFLVNPFLMILALFGVFLLGRETAGSPAGLLAMLAMAASPVLLVKTDDYDSHAGSLAFTTWGIFLLLRWWRTGKLRHAALAGLLLGLSTITRYTEGLLLLPVALVVLFRLGLRWERRDLAGAAALAAGWLLPVGGQVAFNLRALHSLTGYGSTHESTAFSAAYFARNAWPAVSQLFTLGLPLLLPLAILGLALLTLRERRLGLVLWAWALPNLLLYMSYYWAIPGVAYVRFFLTVLPPLALGLAWLLTRPLPGPERLRRWVQPALALALVLSCGAFGVREILPVLKSGQQDQEQAANAAKTVLARAPAGSSIFGPEPALLFLQYAGDYRLYSRAMFQPRLVARLRTFDPRAPNSLQPQRARALYELLKGRNFIQMWCLERDLMAAALRQGRRVFLIAPAGNAGWRRFAASSFDAQDHRSFELRRVGGWSGWEGKANERGERETQDWELLEVTAREAL